MVDVVSSVVLLLRVVELGPPLAHVLGRADAQVRLGNHLALVVPMVRDLGRQLELLGSLVDAVPVGEVVHDAQCLPRGAVEVLEPRAAERVSNETARAASL